MKKKTKTFQGSTLSGYIVRQLLNSPQERELREFLKKKKLTTSFCDRVAFDLNNYLLNPKEILHEYASIKNKHRVQIVTFLTQSFLSIGRTWYWHEIEERFNNYIKNK